MTSLRSIVSVTVYFYLLNLLSTSLNVCLDLLVNQWLYGIAATTSSARVHRRDKTHPRFELPNFLEFLARPKLLALLASASVLDLIVLPRTRQTTSTCQ